MSKQAQRDVGISVIIPVHNGEQTIRGCLQAVFASRFRDFEVIVVEDGCTDGTSEIVREFPCRSLESKSNIGAAAARNLGASHSAGPIIFFLDADVLVPPTGLREIAKAFRAQPGISALFGSYEKNTEPENFCSDYKNLQHHFTHQNSQEEAVTFWGVGAIRREAFAAVGGFDPSLRFMEDVDLGYRLHAAGHRIRLHKSLQLTHCKRYSFWSLVRSDVFGRAIPWTRLMLETRLFRNDLNTKANNVASVPLSFLLLGAPAILPVPPLAGVWLALLLLFLVFNREFLGFVRRERGLAFAGGAAFMCWFGYLYGAAGFGLGLASYASDKLRSSALGTPKTLPPPACLESNEG